MAIYERDMQQLSLQNQNILDYIKELEDMTEDSNPITRQLNLDYA